jgi:hypothetical protein
MEEIAVPRLEAPTLQVFKDKFFAAQTPKRPGEPLAEGSHREEAEKRTTNGLIARDTLLEPDRIKRPPLRAWASEILGALRAAAAQKPARWQQIASCMNVAALIEAYRGDRAGAKELCGAQLRWIGNLTKSHSSPSMVELAFQPWINLGRLLRIEGDFKGALSRFALFLDQAAGRDLRLGPMWIDAARFQQIADETPMLRLFLEGVYVVDSLKTYLAAKDHQGVLAFARRCRASGASGGLPYLEEAEVIALSCLGRYGDALEVTDKKVWQRSPYLNVVSRSYRAAILALSGERESALQLTSRLTARISAAMLEKVRDHRVLRYLYHLGSLAKHLGATDTAWNVSQLGLAGARGFGDEPLTLSFLEARIALGVPDEREALEQERARLLRESVNVTLLHPRGLRADPALASDPIFSELRSAIAELAQG